MATLSSRSVKMVMVALLAEGVDRNEDDGKVTIVQKLSPSSRRAWIEILPSTPSVVRRFVALLAEGVDRNRTEREQKSTKQSRPPRGGRG